MKALRILAATLAVAGAPVLAGTAEVKFADPQVYTDVGGTRGQQFDNIERLARHIEVLAQRLPVNQTLRVDVLDVDLAGTQFGLQPRVVRNMADIPRLHVRYSLLAGGQVLASGEDHLSRLDYAGASPRNVNRSYEALFDEKRLLDDWFASRFGGHAQATR
jgi:hypothetical protein